MYNSWRRQNQIAYGNAGPTVVYNFGKLVYYGYTSVQNMKCPLFDQFGLTAPAGYTYDLSKYNKANLVLCGSYGIKPSSLNAQSVAWWTNHYNYLDAHTNDWGYRLGKHPACP